MKKIALQFANVVFSRAGLSLVSTVQLDSYQQSSRQNQRVNNFLPGALLYSYLDYHSKRLSKPYMFDLHSQLGQDLFAFLSWSSQCLYEPFFVEFGATDGVSLSNTYFLEKTLGWRGICAEPCRSWHSSLAYNRNCAIDHRCVWSESGLTVEFIDYLSGSMDGYGAEYSGIKDVLRQDGKKHTLSSLISKSYEVQTVSLVDLLNFHLCPARFAYLSIDVEGAEFEILSTFDFSRFRPYALSVEHNYDVYRRAKMTEYLERNNYKRVYQEASMWDDWFVSLI